MTSSDPKVQIIGYEGSSEGAIVYWSAAALRIGDELINPTTGASRPWDKMEIDELVADGALELLPRAKTIEATYAKAQLVVLRIVRGVFEQALYVDTGRIGGLAATIRSSDVHYYVFENQAAFDLCARELCTQILTEIVYRDPTKTQRERLLTAALILNSRDPYVNAFRVYFSDNRDVMRELVAPQIAEGDVHRFEDALELLALLDRPDEDREAQYILKYDRGLVPKSGGLLIDAASTLFAAMKSVDVEIRKFVAEEFPFLNEPPPMHVREMKAASAEFHFTPIGELLGDRLARLIELRYLQRALEGEEPSLASDPKIRGALQKITSPDEQTRLQHKPIGEKQIRELSALDQPASRITKSDPFLVVGYQSGLVREGERVEVTYFPGRRLTVPGGDNGDGDQPEGLAFLKTERDFLFTPMIYTFVRHVDERRREHFYLRNVTPLIGAKRKVATITALPSAIVKGSFIDRIGLRVTFDPRGIVSIGDLVDVDTTEANATTAQEWMRAYADACFAHELHLGRSGHRLKARDARPTSLARVIVALHALGGEAPVASVVAEINERFATVVRTNNTRREVLANPSLIEFTGPRERHMTMTERGEAYYAAYVAAGGPLRRADPA